MSESVLVLGINQENARALLSAAKRLKLDPRVVEVDSRGGFLVPKEVEAELANAPGEDDFETSRVEGSLGIEAGDHVEIDSPDTAASGLADGPGGDRSPLGPSKADQGRNETQDLLTDEPPRAGKGSDEGAWRKYATEVKGLEVPEDAKRSDIIALVDEANQEETD